MKIQIEISDLDDKVLQHDLLDVQQWVQSAVDGKINSVKKRLLKEAQEKLFADQEIDMMPATEDKLLDLYFSRPYYESRKQRETEEIK
jgi:hypothetical protein